MKTAKDFFIALPYLCKAENAERWSKLNEMQFDAELASETPFDRTEQDRRDPFNRLHTAFGFTAFRHDVARATYCMILAEIFMLAHYSIEHGETGHDKRIQGLISEAKQSRGEYLDIDEYMTPDLAAIDGGWL